MNFEIKYKNFNIKWDDVTLCNTYEGKSILFNKYFKLLKKTKEKIDKLHNTLDWDNVKKLTNPYELVYIKNSSVMITLRLKTIIPVKIYFKTLFRSTVNFNSFLT